MYIYSIYVNKIRDSSFPKLVQNRNWSKINNSCYRVNRETEKEKYEKREKEKKSRRG